MKRPTIGLPCPAGAGWLALLSAALLSPGAPLEAQAIRGRLVEAATRAPVEGAAIVLLDERDRQIDWRLTDTSGRFHFALDHGGAFRLRADRIGHASIRSDLITVGADQTVVHELETLVEAITLTGLTVETSSRCEIRSEQGVATARVWEEARKALEAAAQTTRQGVYRYVVRRFERELDERGRRVRKEESHIETKYLARPFLSLNAEDLLGKGFVRSEEETSMYYAPDADVLLSDVFLDTHCMRLTEGEDESEGLIGLRFEPVDDRGVTEISGVLWLDPESSQLQWLDYRYENLDVPHPERMGGVVRFEGLPNGTWIVREWTIRMPLLETIVRRDSYRSRPELVGIKEVGGQLVRVDDLRGETVLEAETGTLTGVVLDSLGVGPVEGARVLLDDAEVAVTDADGRFRFTSLMEGRYGVRVSHPALDSLGFRSEPVYVNARPGKVTSVRLRFPGMIPVLLEACDRQSLSNQEGIVMGWVRDPEGQPVPEAVVHITWNEIRRRFRGLVEENVGLEVRTRPDGFFSVCGLPRDRWLEATVLRQGSESSPERFRFLEWRLIRHRDLTAPSGG